MASSVIPQSPCETCAFFSDAIQQSIRRETTVEPARLVASFDRNCSTCNYVLEHFGRTAPDSPLRPECRIRLDIFPQKRFIFRTSCGCWNHSLRHLELLPSLELAPNSVHFKPVNPDRIDIHTLKRWPEYCDEHHAHCRPDSSQASVKDLILIDVQEQCLVVCPVAPKYTTLSYVWGVIPDTFETRLDNFASLQLPNALLDPDVLSRLPSTIQDAIKVTEEMGERYLWVDRLCIIQDDEANKLRQIASMASIYTNAQFTIIAADGADGNAGLQGVGVPRSIPPPPILRFAPSCHMRPGPETEEARIFTPWHNRAWTFQERLLSTRSLIFFRGSVIWQCKTSIWVEGVAGEPDGIPHDETWNKEDNRRAYESFDRRFMLQLQTPARPDFRHFESLVRQYSRRKMGYQTDGLRAFSGILDVLTRTYNGGFLYGLPAMFFDVAMLWEPQPGAKPRLRAPGNKALLFPSWSWAAWEGMVANNLSDDISRSPAAIVLSPVVKWYNVRSDGSTSFVNLAQHFKLFCQRHQQGSDMHLALRLFDKPTIDMSNISVDKSEWDRLLHGRVMTARLHVQPSEDDPALPSSWEEGGSLAVEYHLTDASGKVVGWLKVPVTSLETALRGDALCECIAISECRVVHGDRAKPLKQYYIPEWAMIEETKELDEFEFYNVLWAEWRDGVAYRRGLGRVWKEGWHRQNPETRDVVLG